jgi:hypothetical protein
MQSVPLTQPIFQGVKDHLRGPELIEFNDQLRASGEATPRHLPRFRHTAQLKITLGYGARINAVVRSQGIEATDNYNIAVSKHVWSGFSMFTASCRN